MTNIREITINKNSIPADALISRSFKTGILYPSTSSPNFIIVFIAYSFVDINVYALISGLVTVQEKKTAFDRLTKLTSNDLVQRKTHGRNRHFGLL